MRICPDAIEEDFEIEELGEVLSAPCHMLLDEQIGWLEIVEKDGAGEIIIF